MDVCLLELAENDDTPAETNDPRRLLADCWVAVWAVSADAESASQKLCEALPLVTTEEAALN